MDPVKLNVTAKCSICDKAVRVPFPIESTPRKRVMVCPVCDMITPPVKLSGPIRNPLAQDEQ